MEIQALGQHPEVVAEQEVVEDHVQDLAGDPILKGHGGIRYNELIPEEPQEIVYTK